MASQISTAVTRLHLLSRKELPLRTALLLSEVSHIGLLEWTSRQRQHFPPPPTSAQDNLLKWVAAFVERLHAFDKAIEHLVSDSYLAADLAYGYCGMLLELYQLRVADANALGHFFNLLYTQSTQLEAIGHAASVAGSAEIKDGLVLVMAQLVHLVASASITLYQIFLNPGPGPIDFYQTLSVDIRSFRYLCEKVTIAMSKQHLTEANGGIQGVENFDRISDWLAPDDEVVAALESLYNSAELREENTCIWISSLFFKWQNDQGRLLHITGSSGSGKSVLTSVILDIAKDGHDGVTYITMIIPISARIPAQTTMRSLARSMLYQLYANYPSNIQILQTLIKSLDQSSRITDEAKYDDLLWETVQTAIASIEPTSNPLLVIVDGTDEASCDEAALLQKLVSIILLSPSNVKMITVGNQRPPKADGQGFIEMPRDWTLEDISTVIRGGLQNGKAFLQLSSTEQESIIQRIAQASNGSFLWATMVSKHARVEGNPDQFPQAVDMLISSKRAIVDLVSVTLQMPPVTIDAKWMLLWMALSQRPLRREELTALLSVDLEKQIIHDREELALSILKPVNSLVYVQNGLLIWRHAMIRDAVMDLFSRGHLVPTKDPHGDLLTRLLIHVQTFISEPGEPELAPLSKQDAASYLQESPILDYALRYWPIHLKNMSSFQPNGKIGALEGIGELMPKSTAFIRLQDAIWSRLPTPESLCYRETMTELYRNALGVNHLATVQCMIFLASQYQEVCHLDKAIPLFNEAVDSATSILAVDHPFVSKLSLLVSDLTRG